MSDVLYSNRKCPQGQLSEWIGAIYEDAPPPIAEFHGEWGSVAISASIYAGFPVIDNERHLFCVLGGPLLASAPSQWRPATSKLIYDIWLQTSDCDWSATLSGPFFIFAIDKSSGHVSAIVDMMALIPAFYKKGAGSELCIGTHIDTLAELSGRVGKPDPVSLVDFITYGSITFPYTAYTEIRQLPPASVSVFKNGCDDIKAQDIYWQPREQVHYGKIKDAAADLRTALSNCVTGACRDIDEAAILISAGEDSRLIGSLLPEHVSISGFAFADQWNREAKIAADVCKTLGIKFNFGLREPHHYLRHMQAAGRLIGRGAETIHAHSYDFHRRFELASHPRVFGGYFSDVLIKGCDIKKYPPTGRMPIMPEIKLPGRRLSNQRAARALPDELTLAVDERRRTHLSLLEQLRPQSAEEWSTFWPAGMDMGNPNINIARRLYASYEPFTSSDVIRISAAVPQSWKLNRRLFNAAAAPVLQSTRHIRHADGGFPHLPWQLNFGLRASVWISRRLAGIVRKTGNQGPWNDWTADLASDCFKAQVEEVVATGTLLHPDLTIERLKSMFSGSELLVSQKVNLLQVLAQLRGH
ncbi:asparagine synthase-related protein [Pelagibacterium lentulum]|uniref:asparagine synthase (glutamine-hydrolyzing) n=1 Tax=Pelagibacterium lentulum TaxID=2029865 RepID=A0A916VTT9_9HYPH|nr:asparagine synthase-related protein [Pelagibacterium lentulum]GGA36311.1 hypothetical protein GCM10011499_02080 [Pelagibacterium lentulum]